MNLRLTPLGNFTPGREYVLVTHAATHMGYIVPADPNPRGGIYMGVSRYNGPQMVTFGRVSHADCPGAEHSEILLLSAVLDHSVEAWEVVE